MATCSTVPLAPLPIRKLPSKAPASVSRVTRPRLIPSTRVKFPPMTTLAVGLQRDTLNRPVRSLARIERLVHLSVRE